MWAAAELRASPAPSSTVPMCSLVRAAFLHSYCSRSCLKRVAGASQIITGMISVMIDALFQGEHELAQRYVYL